MYNTDFQIIIYSLNWKFEWDRFFFFGTHKKFILIILVETPEEYLKFQNEDPILNILKPYGSFYKVLYKD